MPEKLERQLKAQARSKGLSGKRASAYVYGTMRKTGWKPSHERGYGGGGGSPCKIMKREGGMHG